MMKRKIYRSAAIALCALLALSGCDAQTGGEVSASPETGNPEETVAATAAAVDTTGLFSDRDLEGTYDESAAIAIRLDGDSAACDSDAVTIEGSRVTIGAEGVYVLSGTLTDGQIVVNAGETDKVQLVLAGVEITSSTSAAIYALEADKVFVTLAEGTENTLTNGGEYVAIDDNNIDAVIFAKTDLTLNGSGRLTINAQAGHGVVSKDDLTITGGSYTVTAASHGLSGKDSIAIAGGTFTITSGKDGIHAENADDLTLGTLYIADGTYTIAAQGDAISAQGALQLTAAPLTCIREKAAPVWTWPAAMPARWAAARGAEWTRRQKRLPRRPKRTPSARRASRVKAPTPSTAARSPWTARTTASMPVGQ